MNTFNFPAENYEKKLNSNHFNRRKSHLLIITSIEKEIADRLKYNDIIDIFVDLKIMNLSVFLY